MDILISTKKLKKSFSKAAKVYCKYSYVQQHICDRLLKHVISNTFPSTILDIGAGAGYFIEKISQYGYNPIGIDIAYGMINEISCKGYSGIVAQSEFLPFKDKTIPISVCANSIQWFVVENFLKESIRITTNYLFIAAFIKGTLNILYKVIKEHLNIDYENFFLEEKTLLGLLDKYHLRYLILEKKVIRRSYPDLMKLLKILKSIGAGNNLANFTFTFKKGIFQKMEDTYKKLTFSSQITADYHYIIIQIKL